MKTGSTKVNQRLHGLLDHGVFIAPALDEAGLFCERSPHRQQICGLGGNGYSNTAKTVASNPFKKRAKGLFLVHQATGEHWYLRRIPHAVAPIGAKSAADLAIFGPRAGNRFGGTQFVA